MYPLWIILMLLLTTLLQSYEAQSGRQFVRNLVANFLLLFMVFIMLGRCSGVQTPKAPPSLVYMPVEDKG